MAGEHKCPLCPATFTRPQHVGRHLRAHTGDRPYECKECPLRFARSDLLSRHVNKAHRTPEPGEPKEKGKKGRRKSMPASAKRPDMAEAKAATTDGQGVQQQQQQPSQRTSPEHDQAQAQAQATERARRASFDQHQPPQLQAQRMYPNHPLLAGTPPPVTWSSNTGGVNGTMRSPVNAFNSAMLGTPTSAGFHPGLASPVRWPGADLGVGSSTMMRNDSGYASSGYDFGMKKRACDQCNHSKVRCDFAHPCTRCSHRNVHCTYNKPPKSRTLPITPGLSYPMSSMPSGNSLSPVSHFSSPPHSMGSPLAQTSFQLQPTQGQLLNTQSPIRNWSNGLPTQNVQPMTQWTPETSIDMSSSQTMPLPSSSVTSQALGMYMPPPPPQQQQQQQQNPMEALGASVPVTQQYLGQLQNTTVSNTSPPQALLPTPSLTSHTTSPSSSDEPAERKASLVGSMTAMPTIADAKNHSYTSDAADQQQQIFKGFTPPAQIDVLPAQGILEQQQQQQPAMSLYHWPTSAFTVDPRYQFREPAAIAQSDDEGEGGTSTAAGSIYNVNSDEPSLVEQRRRSSAGLWASAFNSMSLQDGTGILPMPNGATVPDPYTAVQVAQRAVASQIRPHFPMAPLAETSEPGKMPSLSDVKDVWKLFMQDGAGITPKQEKREGEASSGMAMITPRPGMGRSLSKSNSMPDLTSPSLTAGGQLYLANGEAEQTTGQADSQAPQQQQIAQAGNPGDDQSRRNWQTQISQRQATFTMQPGGRFGRSSADSTNNSSNNNTSMLPPASFNGRPMASIIQHSGALQQTLAPERAPSYGLTPNVEKPNPANITPPQTAGLASWSRTPSKLAQRSSVTTAVARPGNKRLPSQTLVPEAKKRSASFSIWDDGDGDDGALGDTEDDTAQMVAYGMPSNSAAQFGGHSRSISLGHGHGHAQSQNQAALDLSMFLSQSALPTTIPGPGSANYANTPLPMAPPGSWSLDNKAL